MRIKPTSFVALVGVLSLAAACGDDSGTGGSSGVSGAGNGGAGDGGAAAPSSSAATNPQGSSSSGSNPQGSSSSGTNPQGTGGGTGGDNPQGTGGDNPQGTGGDNPQGTGGDNPQGTGGDDPQGTGGGTGGTDPTGTGGSGTGGEGVGGGVPVSCDGAPTLALGTTEGTWAGADATFSPGGSGNRCTGYPADGIDQVYSIALTAGQTLTVTINDTDADAALYLISDCADSAGTCLVGADASASLGETLTARIITTGTYFLVVDQYLDSGGNDEIPFTLTASVEASAPCEDFECGTGQCITEAQLCNSTINCADGSDEAPFNDECECQFLCDSGDQCVSFGDRCDFSEDCDDGSDEADATCEPPMEWDCGSLDYTDSSCDCGCGAPDPACEDGTIDSCDTCPGTGCANNGMSLYGCDDAVIDPTNNAVCL